MRKTVLTVSLCFLMMVAVPFTCAADPLLGMLEDVQFHVKGALVNLTQAKATWWNITGTFNNVGPYFEGPLTFESEGSTTAESSYNDVTADSWYKISDSDGTVLYSGSVAELKLDVTYNVLTGQATAGAENYVLLESPYFTGFKITGYNIHDQETVAELSEYKFKADGHITYTTSTLIPPTIAIASPNPRYHSVNTFFDYLNYATVSAVNSGVNHTLNPDYSPIDVHILSPPRPSVTYNYLDFRGTEYYDLYHSIFPDTDAAPADLEVIVVNNPTVRSTTPKYGAENVAVTQAINVVFSESMDPATITSGNLLINSGGVGVGASVTYSNDTATITPNGNLAYDTGYDVTITDDVTRVSDGPGDDTLPVDYEFSFTTQLDDRVPATGGGGGGGGGCFIGTLH